MNLLGNPRGAVRLSVGKPDDLLTTFWRKSYQRQDADGRISGETS